MNLQIYTRIKEYILSGRKSIAMSVLPGMGLSTMLSNLALEIENKTFARVEVDDIFNIWNKVENYPEERRYLLHLATINALQKVIFSIEKSKIPDEALNLVEFLNAIDFSYDTYLIIEGFEKLPDEMAIVILDEIKFFEDNKSQEDYRALKNIHYIIGGYIDFGSIYKGKIRQGVSSATNFEKYCPSEFLLSIDETNNFLLEYYPDIQANLEFRSFIYEWCGGYLHYILELSKWIFGETRSGAQLSTHHLMLRLKKIIEEDREIPLLKYCNQDWKSISRDRSSLDLLVTAISAGYVICNSHEARSLVKCGLLIQKDFNIEDELSVPNKIVEMFIRQRLAEFELVMPLGEGGIWVVKGLNTRAYSLLVEMENQLRNYIGDKLVYSLNSFSITDIFDHLLDEIDDPEKTKTIERIKNKALGRMKEEDLIMHTIIKDCILSYLDFSELSHLLSAKEDIFPPRLSELLSKAITRVSYFRNRIAHNRPITKSQVDMLQEEWHNMQKVMAMRSINR